MQERTGKELIVGSVLPRFFLALLVSFGGSVISAYFIPEGVAVLLGYIPLIVLLGLLIKMIFTKSNKDRKGLSSYGMRFPMWVVYLFTVLMGIGIYPALGMYIDDMGMEMVVVAFGITAALFGSLFIYTYVTKRDFTFLGGLLFFALLGLILVSVVGMFIQSDFLHLAISWAGILIFSGYMLYDISNMKKGSFTKEDVPSAVFDLYLNFINLFLHILRLLSFIRD